jgi:YbbR domain-containing protein
VTIGIEPIVTKELHIPSGNFAAGSLPDGFSVSLREVEDEESYTIRISGTQEAVDRVTPEDIIGVVDMDMILDKLEMEEWSEGVYQGDITFNLPSDVTTEKTYTMTVEVTKEKDENESDTNSN